MRRLVSLILLSLVALLALPAGAAVTKLGTGSSVTCDTTPDVGSNVDDTSISNTIARVITCSNESGTPVYIGGTGVGSSGEKIWSGGVYKATLAANVVPHCYAATSTTIMCTETLGGEEHSVSPGGRGSRVELLASGTSTSVATTVALVSTSAAASAESTITLPAWCHTVQFSAQIAAITGSPSAWITYFGGLGANDAIAASGLWVQSASVASPAAGSVGFLYVGRDVQTLAASAFTPTGGGGAIVGTAGILPRAFTIKSNFGGAATTLSLVWKLYCVGG